MRLDEIMKALYYKKETYFLDMFGKVKHNHTTLYNDRNNCISEKHIERWLLINDLLNVSAYLNENWIPDWNNYQEKKYIIIIQNNEISTQEINFPCSITYFKTKEKAIAAIEIIGERQLKNIFLG